MRATPLFWRRPPDRPGPKDAPFLDLSVRDGDWKPLCMCVGLSLQLYDLRRDVGQSKNLAALHPDRVATMTKVLRTGHTRMPGDTPQPPR